MKKKRQRTKKSHHRMAKGSKPAKNQRPRLSKKKPEEGARPVQHHRISRDVVVPSRGGVSGSRGKDLSERLVKGNRGRGGIAGETKRRGHLLRLGRLTGILM